MDFKQAEKRFKKLKNQFEAGKLTGTEFKTLLEKLMVQDENKNWWMIGYETELWYRHDGKNWVQTNPPVKVSMKSTAAPGWIALVWLALGGAVGGAIGGTIAWTVSGAIGGLAIAAAFRVERVLIRWISMIWLLLAWTVGGVVGWLLYRAIIDDGGELIALAVGGATGWAIGGFFTAVALRGENVISRWNNVLWITLAWTIGGMVGWIISGAISSEFDRWIGWAIGWALSWVIGGFVTIWQIREGK
ncbi:hypothetical protein FBQ81_07995 [Chloroflexi bacterium CFX6]|nr:hypothetical protein [Chloroflexi bacterium CFX6]